MLKFETIKIEFWYTQSTNMEEQTAAYPMACSSTKLLYSSTPWPYRLLLIKVIKSDLSGNLQLIKRRLGGIKIESPNLHTRILVPSFLLIIGDDSQRPDHIASPQIMDLSEHSSDTILVYSGPAPIHMFSLFLHFSFYFVICFCCYPLWTTVEIVIVHIVIMHIVRNALSWGGDDSRPVYFLSYTA